MLCFSFLVRWWDWWMSEGSLHCKEAYNHFPNSIRCYKSPIPWCLDYENVQNNLRYLPIHTPENLLNDHKPTRTKTFQVFNRTNLEAYTNYCVQVLKVSWNGFYIISVCYFNSNSFDNFALLVYRLRHISIRVIGAMCNNIVVSLVSIQILKECFSFSSQCLFIMVLQWVDGMLFIDIFI